MLNQIHPYRGCRYRGLPSLALLLLLLSCQPSSPGPNQTSSPTSNSTQAMLQAARTGQVIVGLAYHSMAWDGQYLWQYDSSEQQPRLTRQQPGSDTLRAIPVEGLVLSEHESLAIGRQSLWLLARNNQIHQLGFDGKHQRTLQVEGLTVFSGLEALTWKDDQLWVLHKSHLLPDGQHSPATFMQLDPESGKVLKRLPVAMSNTERSFHFFSHENLASDADAFYVVRTSIFDDAENSLYRIDAQTGQVSSQPLERVVTGMPTLFFVGKDLLGVELLDVSSNCIPLCQGRLVVLPTTKPPLS